MSSNVILYRAPWIIPVTSPVIRDGCIAVHGSRILAVGLWEKLSQEYSGCEIKHCSGVLLPGLINAHIHLELSVYGVVSQQNAASNMCDWVRSLLQKRISANFTEQEIEDAAEKAAQQQFATGVLALLDTGNTSLPEFSGKVPEIYSLLELLGPNKKATHAVTEILNNLVDKSCPTAHAPYSTSPELLQSIKKQTLEKGTLFSLHVEENPDESLLLLKGTGCFYEFLHERDALDGTFPFKEGSYRSVLDYLSHIQILDEKTICVHCVNVDDEDVQLLAKTKSHVCLCPVSNSFIGVGLAPLKSFLAHGIIPALGTDSVASNPFMSLWHEMALLRKEFPDVSSETILVMATIAGAKALGCEKDYGSLEPGKCSGFIAIEDEKISTVASKKELLDILTSIENPEKVTHCGGYLAA